MPLEQIGAGHVVLDESEVISAVCEKVWGENTSGFEMKVLSPLWSDFGKIVSILPRSPPTTPEMLPDSVVLKLVRRPTAIVSQADATEKVQFDSKRKMDSYLNEARFYEHVAPLLRPELCRVPVLYPFNLSAHSEISSLLVLEDFRKNFPVSLSTLGINEARTALSWIAAFHARFWGSPKLYQDLVFDQGTYWHLDTRRTELASLGNMGDRWQRLFKLAPAIHKHLRNGVPLEMMTLLHGDCKIANFHFSMDRSSCIGFDFQYVGMGVALKDIVNLLHKCVTEEVLQHRSDLLSFYFFELDRCLPASATRMSSNTQICLYQLCLLDWLRFCAAWKDGRSLALPGVKIALIEAQAILDRFVDADLLSPAACLAGIEREFPLPLAQHL